MTDTEKWEQRAILSSFWVSFQKSRTAVPYAGFFRAFSCNPVLYVVTWASCLSSSLSSSLSVLSFSLHGGQHFPVSSTLCQPTGYLEALLLYAAWAMTSIISILPYERSLPGSWSLWQTPFTNLQTWIKPSVLLLQSLQQILLQQIFIEGLFCAATGLGAMETRTANFQEWVLQKTQAEARLWSIFRRLSMSLAPHSIGQANHKSSPD